MHGLPTHQLNAGLCAGIQHGEGKGMTLPFFPPTVQTYRAFLRSCPNKKEIRVILSSKIVEIKLALLQGGAWGSELHRPESRRLHRKALPAPVTDPRTRTNR